MRASWGPPVRACPQGSVSTLPPLAKHIVSQQEEQEEQGLMPEDGERGLTSSCPTCPVWEVGAKLYQTGASTLGDGSSAGPSRRRVIQSGRPGGLSGTAGRWSLWGTALLGKMDGLGARGQALMVLAAGLSPHSHPSPRGRLRPQLSFSGGLGGGGRCVSASTSITDMTQACLLPPKSACAR